MIQVSSPVRNVPSQAFSRRVSRSWRTQRVIARIVPQALRPQAREWPNFGARVKKIFAERVLPGADLVVEERGRY